MGFTWDTPDAEIEARLAEIEGIPYEHRGEYFFPVDEDGEMIWSKREPIFRYWSGIEQPWLPLTSNKVMLGLIKKNHLSLHNIPDTSGERWMVEWWRDPTRSEGLRGYIEGDNLHRLVALAVIDRHSPSAGGDAGG